MTQIPCREQEKNGTKHEQSRFLDCDANNCASDREENRGPAEKCWNKKIEHGDYFLQIMLFVHQGGNYFNTPKIRVTFEMPSLSKRITAFVKLSIASKK